MARSPLIVDITPHKRQPGRQFPFKIQTEPPDDLALATAGVTATRLDLDLELESIGLELVVAGTIGVEWIGPCRRCLEDQQGRTDIETREIFAKDSVDGETYELDEDQVDLEPMVRETVLLHLPVAPLCTEDCSGPDPDRFPTSVEADAGSEATDEPAPDPRWAALDDLDFD